MYKEMGPREVGISLASDTDLLHGVDLAKPATNYGITEVLCALTYYMRSM
ncbi:hypothetical protein Syun_001416 [Stephania yunnanensis]|uniref:Uncharacterized protein n=1 Tax=Stephania yunnanensis TaxID=152371 RepID=A0AAP0LE19_9MAGN